VKVIKSMKRVKRLRKRYSLEEGFVLQFCCDIWCFTKWQSNAAEIVVAFERGWLQKPSHFSWNGTQWQFFKTLAL